jgi:hypothetical protein
MDVTGAEQALAGGGSPRGVLARVMHCNERKYANNPVTSTVWFSTMP